MSEEDPRGLLKRIGLRIAEIRIGKGWSRETCAAEIGVGTRYLAKLEGGHQNMSILKLAHVAEYPLHEPRT